MEKGFGQRQGTTKDLFTKQCFVPEARVPLKFSSLGFCNLCSQLWDDCSTGKHTFAAEEQMMGNLAGRKRFYWHFLSSYDGRNKALEVVT